MAVSGLLAIDSDRGIDVSLLMLCEPEFPTRRASEVIPRQTQGIDAHDRPILHENGQYGHSLRFHLGYRPAWEQSLAHQASAPYVRDPAQDDCASLLRPDDTEAD
jgi:hypothetical protein